MNIQSTAARVLAPTRSLGSDRVPAPGESVEKAGFRFEVREADRKRVRLVHVSRIAPGEALPQAGGGAS